MNKKYILPAVAAIAMMASCADEFNPEYSVERPVDLEKLAELADYKPLKENINREAHPGFKLGAALAADEFNKQLGVYNVAVTNFDEIVAGNAMKYASVVDDKGNMNFGTVNSFVTTATKAGLSVYGHTLAWHSQQRPKYLNGLLADKPKPIDPNDVVEKDVTDYTLDCGTLSGLGWNGCPAEVAISYGKDGCVSFSNTAPVDPWYAFQYWLVNGISLKEGTEYRITINCRYEGADDVTINFKLGDWGGGAEKKFTVPANGDFADVSFTGTATMDSNGIFLQHNDGFVGTIYWNSITISHKEVSAPTDVEYKEVYNLEDLQFIARDATHNDTDAEIIKGGGPNGKDAIKIVGKTNPAEEWDTQFFVYTPNKKWDAGSKYRFHMWYKANKAIGTDTQVHGTPGGYIHWQMLNPNPSFTTDWQEKTWEATIPGEGGGNQQSIAFNLNKNKESDPGFVYEYYFSDITWESVSKVEVPKVEVVVVDYVENGDMEGSEAKSFAKKENSGGVVYEITDGVGKDGSRGVAVKSNGGQATAWESQFWIVLNEAVTEGTELNVKFDYRATINGQSIDTQAHFNPGEYQHWSCAGNPNFTTDWQTYTKTFKVDASMAGANGMKSIAFNLSPQAADATYYFDNIRVWSQEEREIKSTIPLTPEEKHDTLVWAMENWISGMMDACEGNVKAWDVVNEAISGGGNDGEGNYELQHAKEGDASNFYWQDHMGDLEYVRQAVRLARKYYAVSLEEKGGDDGQLKLFINDYNLESDWDQNKKVKSLINWIKKWEADGVTKIDGIGSQMHISYYEDANTLQSKKNAIVESFKLMAATGKLVRISELDMGYVKADGKDAGLDEMTKEMEQKMEEYYQWIIEQYFANVPVAQQYGITQWCLTDSEKGSGWRPDTPVGLWDLNWNRKYTYRGWVNGLQK